MIIPTMNEEGGIERVISSIQETLDGTGLDYELLVVDTLSTDRTREIAMEKGARVIEESQRGYGRAYKTGFQEAQGSILVTMDADCTYRSSTKAFEDSRSSIRHLPTSHTLTYMERS